MARSLTRREERPRDAVGVRRLIGQPHLSGLRKCWDAFGLQPCQTKVASPLLSLVLGNSRTARIPSTTTTIRPVGKQDP